MERASTMGLVCLALLFTLKERIAHVQSIPLLIVRDIVELLEIYQPRCSRDPDDVLAAMSRRHQTRMKLIDSAQIKRRKQQKIIAK